MSKQYTNLVISGFGAFMFYRGGSYDVAMLFAFLFGMSLADLLFKKGWVA